MIGKRVVGSGLFLVIFFAGFWLLFQEGRLPLESPQRRDAIKQVMAPGGVVVEADSAVSTPPADTLISGGPIQPAVVHLRNLPAPEGEAFSLEKAWKSGLVDLGGPEEMVPEAVMEKLRAESARQPVDHSVQVLNTPKKHMPDEPSGLTTIRNFEALNYGETGGFSPPDPILAVGDTHVIAAVNTSFEIYTKDGAVAAGPVSYADFFGANCGTGPGMFLFDPFVAYDESTDRYIIGIDANETNPLSNNGTICIAVSKTSDPTGIYYQYSFNGNPGDGIDYFIDFPHLGVGQKALYLSANAFNGSFYVRSHVMAFDKEKMYQGLPASYVVGYSALDTLQPAKIHGHSSGGWPAAFDEPHFYVSAAWGNNKNRLYIFGFTDPFGPDAAFTLIDSVTVNSYNLPIHQPQFGGSAVRSNDNSLLDVKYWDGKLYATHTIGCNPGEGTNNCVRWYVLDSGSGSPSLIDQGTLSSAEVGNGRIFPAIAANRCGDILLGYTMGSPDGYYSSNVAGREVGDPAGQLKAETLQKAGGATYHPFDPSPHRWGDYTGMAIDPNGLSYWYIGEFAEDVAGTNWATWISEHRWTGCTDEEPEPTSTPTSTATATATSSPTATATTTATVTATATATAASTDEPPEEKYKLYLPVLLR